MKHNPPAHTSTLGINNHVIGLLAAHPGVKIKASHIYNYVGAHSTLSRDSIRSRVGRVLKGLREQGVVKRECEKQVCYFWWVEKCDSTKRRENAHLY